MAKRLYLDMDGVLADFDQGCWNNFGTSPEDMRESLGESVFWEHILGVDNFFRQLPLMHNAQLAVSQLLDLRPVILTGCPRSDPSVAWQKARWANKHFRGIPVATCYSREKHRFCQPGDVLVDDRDHYQDLWEAKGGRFLHFKGGWTLNKVLEIMTEFV